MKQEPNSRAGDRIEKKSTTVSGQSLADSFLSKPLKNLKKIKSRNIFSILLASFIGASVVCGLYALGITSSLVAQGGSSSDFQTGYVRWSNWVSNSHEIAGDESIESSVLNGRRRGFVAALARYEDNDFKTADAGVFLSGCQVFAGVQSPQVAPCYKLADSSTGLFKGVKLEGNTLWLASSSGKLLWRFDAGSLSHPPLLPENLSSYSTRTTLKRLLWGMLFYMMAAGTLLTLRWRSQQNHFQQMKKQLADIKASGNRIFGEFFSGEWTPDLVSDESAIIHKLKRHLSGGKRQGATIEKQDFLSAVGSRLPSTSFLRFLDMQVDKSLSEHAGLRESLFAFKDQCSADFTPAREQFQLLLQVWKEGIESRGLKRFLRYLSETPAGSHHANCLDRDLEFLESFLEGLHRYSGAMVNISDLFLNQGEKRIAWDKKMKHFLMLLSGRNDGIRLQTVGDTLTHLFRDEMLLYWEYADLEEAAVPKEILFSLFFSLELAAQIANVSSESLKVQVRGRLDTIYLAIEPSSFDEDQKSHYVESLRQIFRVTDYETFQVQLSGEKQKATLVFNWEPENSSVLLMKAGNAAVPQPQKPDGQRSGASEVS